MPFIVIFIAILVGILSSVSKNKKLQEAAQAAAKQRQQAAQNRGVPQAASGSLPVTGTETSAERARRQEELKRRLLENQARRQAEQAKPLAQTASASAASFGERRPLEKRVMESNLRKEKPIVAHTDDECGGGSMHDGYHEGVTQFAGRAEASVAGKLGHKLADEDDRIERELAAAENAKRALARISKLPPLAQGMIYSEILGKPRSEIA